MKNKTLNMILVMVMLFSGLFAVAGCAKDNDQGEKAVEEIENNMLVYIESEVAWIKYEEAKYKLSVNYENSLNNIKIDEEGTYQSGKENYKTSVEYVLRDPSLVDPYVIRVKYDNTDKIYYNGNEEYDVKTKVNETEVNYDKFKLYEYMGCLSNEDISKENMLISEIKNDGTYVLKFTKSFDGAGQEYDAYEAYYELEISNDGIFKTFKSYTRTGTSSGYTKNVQKYSYGTVVAKEILDLIA